MDTIKNIVLWDRETDARRLSQEGIEVWAPVHIAPQRYLVSNMGRVLSRARDQANGRVMDLTLSSAGYATVGLYPNRGGRSETWLVHRLVCWAFDGAPPLGKDEVRHLHDPNKGNNRLDNLAWGTKSENMLDVGRHARQVVAERSKMRPKSTRMTHLLDEDKVRAGLSLFTRGKMDLEALSAFLGCTEAVARGIVQGDTWTHLDRDQEAISRVFGRNGEAHHLSRLTDAKVAEGLALYVKHRWSARQFAEHLGITHHTAPQILSGRTWQHVPRPPGLQYPWPNAARMNRLEGGNHPMASMNADVMAGVLAQIAKGELDSVPAISAATGLSRSAVFALLGGRSWASLPRPPGFQDAVARMQRPPRLEPHVVTEIKAQLRAGVPCRAIAERLEVPLSRVRAYLTQVNKEPRET